MVMFSKLYEKYAVPVTGKGSGQIDEWELCAGPVLYLYNKVYGDLFNNPNVTDHINVWYNVPKEKFEVIKALFLLTFCAVVTLEDVEDNVETRRGCKSTHIETSLAKAVNSALYIEFFVIRAAKEVHDQGPEFVTNALICVHHGRGLQIIDREDNECPSEERYMRILRLKASDFGRWICDIMKDLGSIENDEQIRQFYTTLLIYLQIREEYRNLKMRTDNYCSSLQLGTYTYPVIRAIHKHPKDNRLVEIFTKKPKDMATKKQALQLIEELGGFEDTRKKLNELEEKMQKCLKALPENKLINNFLDLIKKQDVI